MKKCIKNLVCFCADILSLSFETLKCFLLIIAVIWVLCAAAAL